MKFSRASGILLHITSLPSRFGIGDLGPAAFEFVDFLKKAGQKHWQILPLGQTGYGNSPYLCYSAFAGNIYLISLEKLVEDGFLSGSDLVTAKSDDTRVDFASVIDLKVPLLRKAFENFRQKAEGKVIEAFHRFCDENAFWLEDYALYRALQSANGDKGWHDWEISVRLREPAALEKARKDLDDDYFAEKFYQFVFFSQWRAVKQYANSNGIGIIGDVPIYVAYDSSDVWCDQKEFKLDENGSMEVVAGVPPDFFSETGQLWGSPIYRWDKMRDDGFKWWVKRIRFTLQIFDIARIDHFIGFTRAWEIPSTDDTAVNGVWVNVPGNDLFSTLKHALGDVPLIAEDLGVVTPAVENLRDSFGLPGMRILQFGFGDDAKNEHLPHNYVQNSVVYTGTHDNETIVGWYKERRGKKPPNEELIHCLKYLRTNGTEIHWEFISEAFASTADTAIIPMQDVLGLDNGSRMNLPATVDGNWIWRVKKESLSDKIAERLRDLADLYGR